MEQTLVTIIFLKIGKKKINFNNREMSVNEELENSFHADFKSGNKVFDFKKIF